MWTNNFITVSTSLNIFLCGRTFNQLHPLYDMQLRANLIYIYMTSMLKRLCATFDDVGFTYSWL